MLNKPFFESAGVRIYNADCRDILGDLKNIDACITDPPYGIELLAHDWDKQVPSPEIWAAVLNAVKPGAHLLAFSSTRTYHLMASSIEQSGFDIRDMVSWVFGSGFPKSLDVSKAIDKLDAKKAQRERQLRFTYWVRSQGVTSKQIDEATGTRMGGHYTTPSSQPAVMTREHLEMCRHLFSEVPDWVEKECDQRSVESQNFKKREVVEEKKAGKNPGFSGKRYTEKQVRKVVKVTKAKTEEAQKWEGWGTTLKPAFEPVVLARKPYQGTTAENLVEHGAGALNIDATRVYGGRWPANFIHDNSEEVTKHLPSQAPRFFYSPKASVKDRGEYNDHPTVKPVALMEYLIKLVTPQDGVILDPFAGSGSTLVSAHRLGIRAIGIEKDERFCEIAARRIEDEIKQPRLGLCQ